ncbi:MAG: TetR/AcrR family transcriptional regulator [Bacteroidales bacterium]|jgi:AcrR family transcriptional regulator|nr:TetR/AcrR family transcriptional regulator [Bacteroidales bacterium]
MILQERILEKARAVFFSQGIRSVSMSDLAEALGISKRTLYQIFPSKDELLRSLLQTEYEKFKTFFEKKRKEENKNIIHILFEIITYMKHLMEGCSPLFLKDMEKYHTDIFDEYCSKIKKKSDEFIEKFFVVAQKQGYIRPEINLTIAHSAMEVIMRFQHENIKSEKYSKMEILKSVTYPFIRGVFTEDGKKIINKLNKEMISEHSTHQWNYHHANEFIEI